MCARMRLRIWMLALPVALVAAACSGGSASPGTITPSGATPTASPSPTVSPTGSPTASPTAPAPQWEAMARAPIVGRIAEGVVWTGRRVIIWGGLYRGAQVREVTDGAIYDPAADAWHKIAAPPSVPKAVEVASAWTGIAAVFWAGNSPDDPAVGLVYNPASDSWKRLPDGPLGNREGFASFWTGTELAIVGGTSGDGFASPVAAAVTPKTGAWRQLAALNALQAFITSGAVWNGHRAFIAGARYLCPDQGSSCTKSKATFLAYDPATDTTKAFDLTRAPVDPSERDDLTPIGWTGTEVALTVGADLGAGVIFFDPVTGAWRTGARAPVAVGSEQRAWLGDRYVLTASGGRLQIYDVADDTWHVIGAGTSPMTTRSQSAIVWTGSELIVWSGYTGGKGNPTPNTGAFIKLPS